MTRPVEAILADAASARQRGDIAATVTLFDEACQAAPDNAGVHNAAGNFFLTHDAARAQSCFAQAVELDSAAPVLWLNLAKAQRLLGDDEGERASLEAILSIDRTDFMAWLRKAELHERLGEAADAVQAWQGVLQLVAGLLPAASPDLQAVLAAGQAYVDTQTAVLGKAVDAALGERLDALAETDQRRASAFVAHALGRRPVYRNECAGLYYPFLPADEFFDRHHFEWLDNFEAQTPAIRAELEALLAQGFDDARPYVQMDTGSPTSKWSPLDGSLDWSACFLWEYGERNDAMCERCPDTARAIEAVPRAAIPGRAPTAFFSILKPHTRIPPHTGVSNTRAIVHLPLIVPDGCGFRVGGETRLWREGEALVFDDTIEHEAWNDSDSLRAVLILDVWNPYLSAAEQAIVADYCAAADATGLNPRARD